MYTVLVVDDEKLAREDIIYKVGASGFPFDWIMEAESGEEALAIVKSNHPDIMLTDIMMGEMSGLDLINETNKIAPQMISVIICGYPDFTFAQRAVKLNVMNYLLKPVKPNELISVLYDVTNEITRRREQLYLSSNNYALRKRVESYKLREQVRAFVNGDLKTDSSKILSFFPENSKWFQFWNIRIEDVNGIFFSSEENEERLLYGIKNIIEEVGGGSFVAVDSMEKGRMVLSIVSSQKEKKEEAEAGLLYYANKIKQLVENGLMVKINIGTSKLSSSLSSANIIEARKATDVRFYYTAKGIWDILQFEKLGKDGDDRFKEPDMKILKNFVADSDAVNAIKIVEKIMLEYKNKPYLNIRDTYMEIIGTLSRFSYKKGVSILGYLGYENISGSIINKFNTIEEIVQNLSSIIEMSLGNWVKYMENTSEVLEKVKKYIDENFSDSELCTNKLAQNFRISLGYLSATYKKKYNITISKYIIAKRMEYAAKLLSETSISINHISESSGFNNLSYFMRVFKAYYGITPTHYREGAEK